MIPDATMVYERDVNRDEFIEATAQMEADVLGISREEAVSLMATLLPHLERWKNEACDESSDASSDAS